MWPSKGQVLQNVGLPLLGYHQMGTTNGSILFGGKVVVFGEIDIPEELMIVDYDNPIDAIAAPTQTYKLITRAYLYQQLRLFIKSMTMS
ncbi:hypothetical protein Lal_00026621 [Lupinus albus]|nr:hypothetical protein Lal_00026621 [Lupinus albus]